MLLPLKNWSINMRKNIGVIIVATLVGACLLIPAAAGEITDTPRRYYEVIEKKDFPCYDKWWAHPLTRDRIFRSLGLTGEQRKEVGKLRNQFRDDLSALKRRHNESLLNVLDVNQRRKLEEKSGVFDRYFEEKIPQQWRRHGSSIPGRSSTSYILDLNLLEVGTSKKLMDSGIGPSTWGGIKKEFN